MITEMMTISKETPTGAQRPPVTPHRLMQAVNGFAPPILIDTAVQLGMFDALSSGPLAGHEVAERCHLTVRGTLPVLDALAGLDWLKKADGRYSLSPEAAVFLVKTSPGFVGGLVRHHLRSMLPVWQQLPEVVRTGAPAARLDDESQGSPYFRDFAGALFSLNHPAARMIAETLLAAHGPKPARVLDIGAGSGVFGIAFAAARQNVQVTAADWKDVLALTREIAAKWNVLDRFSFAAGDMFASDFGSGFDVALLGNILHMEGPERCQTLLRKAYQALAPGGSIAILEFVPDDDRTGPPMALIFAISMLVHTTGGCTYTFRELNQWLREAGFTNVRRLDTPSPSPAILAKKPV